MFKVGGGLPRGEGADGFGETAQNLRNVASKSSGAPYLPHGAGENLVGRAYQLLAELIVKLTACVVLRRIWYLSLICPSLRSEDAQVNPVQLASQPLWNKSWLTSLPRVFFCLVFFCLVLADRLKVHMPSFLASLSESVQALGWASTLSKWSLRVLHDLFVSARCTRDGVKETHIEIFGTPDRPGCLAFPPLHSYTVR